MTSIFLSYVEADKEIANQLSKLLHSNGIEVRTIQAATASAESIQEKITKLMTTSDYVIVLLSSASAKSKWLQTELRSSLLGELRERDITIIPVIVEDCEIPPFLRHISMIDLRPDFNAIVSFVEKITGISKIDFPSIDARKFELLIADLLKQTGFSGIESQRIGSDRGYDFIGYSTYTDPFGKVHNERWIIEVKFYHSERTDLNSLRQIVGSLEYSGGDKALLVTNGQLTSTARKWIEHLPDSVKSRLRIIEGPELKQLLLSYPKIIRKYFDSGEHSQVVSR